MKKLGYTITLPSLLLLTAPVLAGNIYVCKGKHGEKVYQNSACTSTAQQLDHRTYDDALARPSTTSQEAHTAIPDDLVWSRAGVAASVAATPAKVPSRNSSGGIGSSAYQRGEIQGMRCVTSAGKVYYTAGTCGTTTRIVGDTMESRDWHNDTVQGMPGAVMVSPDEALDPQSGRVMQLQGASDTEDVTQTLTTRDQGTPVDADVACAMAQRSGNRRQVEALCRQGRSLYDLKPSIHSLYQQGH